MDLINRLGGRIENLGLGNALVVERSAREIGAEPLVDYVEKNMPQVTEKRVHEVFPEIAFVPRDNLLFFDTENCGLSSNDPVFLLALAHMNGTLRFQSVLARDFSEEKVLVNYFKEQLKNYRGFVTYNGHTFDVPRLNQRAIRNGLVSSGSKTISQTLEGRHFDLYPLVRKRLDIGRTKTLQALEKVLFKYHRTHDIPGERIPIEYKKWVYEGGNDEVMEKIVNHNLIDTLSVVALFTYLCCHR